MTTGNDTTKDYVGHAQRIAQALGLTVTITPGPTDKCPRWVDGPGPNP